MQPRVLLAIALIASTVGSAAAAPRAPTRKAKVGPPRAERTPFEPEIRAFQRFDQVARPEPGGFVFTGSSSIRLWKGLEDDFRGYPVINRGFGGSHIAHSTRYADKIILPYRPRAILLYAGSNDLHDGKTPARVVADYRAFVAKIHAGLPEARIAFVSIAPSRARWDELDRVREVNRRIAAYTATDPRLHFIDVFSAMLGADGRPLRGIYVKDGLHLTRKGYLIWHDRIAPHMPALMWGAARP